MLTAFFGRRRLQAAAKRFARDLPPQLSKDYGASKFYTPQQIETSAARARLPRQYVWLGYALFLDKAAFDTVAESNDLGSYDGLRQILARYAAHREHTGFQAAPENSDAFAGSSTWPLP